MKAWSPEDFEKLRLAAGRPYVEFLREASMSAGLYVLAAGAVDPQQPHSEDEIYVVMAGRSRFTAADETRTVAPGDVIFVAAHVPHRFHDIAEELRITHERNELEIKERPAGDRTRGADHQRVSRFGGRLDLCRLDGVA